MNFDSDFDFDFGFNVELRTWNSEPGTSNCCHLTPNPDFDFEFNLELQT